MISSRGHIVESVAEFPLVVTDELEGIGRTSQTKEILRKLGLWQDVERDFLGGFTFKRIYVDFHLHAPCWEAVLM
ncbi:hypothetical protein ES703_111490 [subsurface metagenome]